MLLVKRPNSGEGRVENEILRFAQNDIPGGQVRLPWSLPRLYRGKGRFRGVLNTDSRFHGNDRFFFIDLAYSSPYPEATVYATSRRRIRPASRPY